MRARDVATAAVLAAAVGGVGGVVLHPRSSPSNGLATGVGPSDAWRVGAPQIVTPHGGAEDDCERLAVPAVPTTLRPAPLRDTSSRSHALLELEREARLAGQYLVRSPAVLRGCCGGSGQLTERLPVLSNAETLGLIQRSWFFITASEARRELQEEAAEARGSDALYSPPVSHFEVLGRMRTTSADERERARRKGGGGQPAAAGSAPCPAGGEGAPPPGSGDGVAATGTGAVAAAGGVSLPPTGAAAGVVGEGLPGLWAVPRAGASSPCWPSRDVAEMRELLPSDMCDVEFRLRETIGRAAYSQLFAHNQALIHKEVNSLLPNWRDASVIEKADYLQEGAQGLLRALRLFDVRRGIAFSTYAVWHIRAYVLRAIRDKGRLVRLPQALQQDMQQIRKARYRFAVDQQGATPAAAQLAEMLSWTEDRVAAAITGLASSACLSLDADVDAPGDGAGAGRASSARSLGDGVAGGSVVGGCALGRAGVVNHAEAGLTVRDSFASTLAAAQRGRNPRRAEMTRLKYGLEDGREWTYQQLAARFNLTADGARGIVRAEVAYLRKEKAKLLAQFY